MNILIIGSGGREHALAWKISQSKLCRILYVAPGNAGTSKCATNLIIDITNFDRLKEFCLEHHVEMVIVGPEAPLVAGITDSFRKDEKTKHIKLIGPNAYAAQLEGSKAFAKKFMSKYKIPTAGYLEVNSENLEEGIDFLKGNAGPYVLKADGLAAGKGVLILENVDEAIHELRSMIGGKFGSASSTVVIEEFLDGIEFSMFAMTDGKSAIVLPEAKDYKRIGEGDTGLNTGGMGAISPVPFVDSVLLNKVYERIINPTIAGIAAERMDYVGFVFFGLISVRGEPFVIEYNCRLGDPETEVVIPRIENDIVEIFDMVATDRINQIKMEISSLSAATVMLVAGGYPGDYQNGKVIHMTDGQDSLIFHAGTKMVENKLVTSGGRVITITSLHQDFRMAVSQSIDIANKIDFEGKYFRKDIGFDL